MEKHDINIDNPSEDMAPDIKLEEDNKMHDEVKQEIHFDHDEPRDLMDDDDKKLSDIKFEEASEMFDETRVKQEMNFCETPTNDLMEADGEVKDDNYYDEDHYDGVNNVEDHYVDDVGYDEEGNEDFTIELDCIICSKTFKSSKSLLRHSKSCMKKKIRGQLPDIFETLPEDPEKGKCKLCGQIVTKHAANAHKIYYHDAMILGYTCPGENCSYVSAKKSNVLIHMKRHHANENLSKTLHRNDRKYFPNPHLNFDKYKLNRPKGTAVEKGKRRFFVCPKCQFRSENLYNVRKHILRHRKDMDADDFTKLLSMEVPKIIVDKEQPESIAQDLPSVSLKDQQDPPKSASKDAMKLGKSEFQQQSCCGKTFNTRLGFREHHYWVHQTHVNMFLCPVQRCSVQNMKRHKIKSHIIGTHAKRLSAEEIENYLKPENILSKYMLNPKYVPTMKEEIKEEFEQEKDVKCDMCHKGFGCESELKRHEQEFHSFNTMQKCPMTGCTFRRRRKAHLKCNVSRKNGTRDEMDDEMDMYEPKVSAKSHQPSSETSITTRSRTRASKSKN